jgi:hypothetical protein
MFLFLQPKQTDVSKAEPELEQRMFAGTLSDADLEFVAENDYETLRTTVARYNDIIAEYSDSTLPEAKVRVLRCLLCSRLFWSERCVPVSGWRSRSDRAAR